MSDWNDETPGVKEAAAFKFCQRLEEDLDGIRERCKRDMKTARDTLREAGNFTNMPADLPVYVFEDDPTEMGKVVAIVLPKKGEMPNFDHFDIDMTWPCTWTPYALILNARTRKQFTIKPRDSK
jgi:hypothetical protein